VAVEARLRDLATEVTITQRYRNAEAHPIEAVYVFPLDEGAAVCGFEAWIGDVHVVGEVKERDAAFEAYDDALAAGHGAYLLDQERPDVFTASIGNVPPGVEVLIRIRYAAEATLEGDALRFALPTTVSPRYAPAEDQVGVGRSRAEAVNPPLAWTVPYGLTLHITLDMPSAIRAVASPSHPIALTLEGATGTVDLGEGATSLDRDFVLLITLAEPHAPAAWLERDGETGHVVALAFQPRFETDEAPAEVIFVLDRSGSMGGSSIQEAKNALQLCLRSLRDGCRFNIVGFGSSFEILFPESRPYANDTLQTASTAVAAMDADLGGTEILAPLQAILATAPHPEIPRQLFILTDGQVTNTEAVIGLLRKHAATTRVFTFGIGRGASHHLVRGMARAANGAAEFIYPGERIEPKVLRQLGKALAPALTDVRVDWGGRRVTRAPSHLPPLFAGRRTLLYGFLPEGLPESVTLRARGATGPMEFRLRLDADTATSGHLLATLAARTLIRELEDQASETADRRGSRQRRGQPDRLTAEIIRLGTTYQVCSSHTSFVAIERRETPVEGDLQLRKVPVLLTHGWGGEPMGMLRGLVGAPPPPAMPMDAILERRRAIVSPSVYLSDASMCLEDWEVPKGAAQAAPRPLDRLILLQAADGSWDLSEELADILGCALSTLEAALHGAAGDAATVRRAWATALALAFLEVRVANAEDEWALLAAKARTWLGQCGAVSPTGEPWIVLAQLILAQG
jgi:Ca-activated chloride channel family protein